MKEHSFSQTELVTIKFELCSTLESIKKELEKKDIQNRHFLATRKKEIDSVLSKIGYYTESRL